MELAKLHGSSVRDCLSRMSATEFAVWRQMYFADPWDERRADWRAALVAYVTALSQCDSKSSHKINFEDFLYHKPEPVLISWEAGSSALHASVNGKLPGK